MGKTKKKRSLNLGYLFIVWQPACITLEIKTVTEARRAQEKIKNYQIWDVEYALKYQKVCLDFNLVSRDAESY